MFLSSSLFSVFGVSLDSFACILVQSPLRQQHTTTETLESAAIFLKLGLPSTLIDHENGTFRKCSSNRGNLKTPAFRFTWTENISKTKLSKNDGVTCDFPNQHKSKMIGNCCVLKFLPSGVVCAENISCFFRAKPLFLKSHPS